MSKGGHLSHEEFFTRLTTLLTECHAEGDGSIHLAQKRLTHGQSPTENVPEDVKHKDNPLWDLNPPNPLPVLVRASNGKLDKSKKQKISTVVQPDELEGFYTRYAEVCRKGMERLRPRVRTKKKKDKKAKKGGVKKEEAYRRPS